MCRHQSTTFSRWVHEARLLKAEVPKGFEKYFKPKAGAASKQSKSSQESAPEQNGLKKGILPNDIISIFLNQTILDIFFIIFNFILILFSLHD